MSARRMTGYAALVGLVLMTAGCERAKKAGSEAVRLGEGINETSKRDDISRIKAQLTTAAPSCRTVNRALYERMAEKYRGGKGYAGAYAHLIDKTNGKSFYVVVPNLNRRQNIGELAGPDTLRFDSLQELDLFVKTQLGTYELYSVWDVDPDPTGRYSLVK